MLTGDASVNPDAPLLTATAEVVANHALRDGADTDLGLVVMDEFHYYARPGARLGLAGAAAGAPPRPVPAHVGDPRRGRLLPRRPHPPDRTDHGRRGVGRAAGTADVLLREDAGARDARGAALHRPGTGLRRAPDAGGGAGARPGAHQRERREPGAARRDRRRARGVPLPVRLRPDPVPAGAARRRRAPRRSAAALPAAGRDAGPGRAAQGGLRHGHARGRHQRADPHGPGHVGVEVRRHPGAAPHRPGVPPGRRSRRAGRLRHRRDRGGAGTGPRRRERAAPGQGGRRPEEAEEARAQEGSRGFRLLGRADLRTAGRGAPGAAALELPRHPRDAAQRPRPARRPVPRDAAPARGQPRAAGRAAAAHQAGDRDLPCPGRRRGGAAGRPARPRRPPLGADRRPAARLRAQPAAVAARRRHPRPARPRLPDVRPGRALGRRGDAGGPAAGGGRPAEQGPRRGGGRDEGGGHRVRGADGAAGGRHLPAAARRAAGLRLRHLPRAATRGSPTTSSSPSPSRAT